MLGIRGLILIGIALGLFACGRQGEPPVARSAGTRAATPSETHKYPPRIHAKREPKPIARPTKTMTLPEAQKYFLRLINRDREREGLEPVVPDAIAEKAAEEHAYDMAHHGFTAHWGTDGSVPETRYTGAGGMDIVHENVGCFADGTERQLEKHPLFAAEQLETVESAFINEKPPHDGHRRNILTPWHNRVGIGLAQAAGVPIACVAQEFVDDYGTYAALPSSANVGKVVDVSGEIVAPALFGGVAVARIDPPATRTGAMLNGTGGYLVPRPYVSYFPKGYVTPIPVRLHGNRFSIDVPLDDERRAGIYEVSVWARVPEDPNLVMVSLRTIVVK